MYTCSIDISYILDFWRKEHCFDWL